MSKDLFHEPLLESDKMGKIQVIFGPMFSGKSTELIRRMKRYQYANYRCMLIRYAKDDRYDTEMVSTHDRVKMKSISAIELTKLTPLTKDIDVIGIDEGQFFPDIVKFAEDMANVRKVVVVAALDGTFQRTGFANILELVPLAESVEKLTAVCMSCFRDAAFTKRIGLEKEVELIGGVEKYMAVCRNCHHLEAPVKRSPFKALEQNNALASPNQKTAPVTSRPEVDEKKRKLFETENELPTKSLRTTEV